MCLCRTGWSLRLTKCSKHPIQTASPLCACVDSGVSLEHESWWCGEAAPSADRLGREHQAEADSICPNLPNRDGKGEVLFTKPVHGPGGIMRWPSGATVLQQRCHSLQPPSRLRFCFPVPLLPAEWLLWHWQFFYPRVSVCMLLMPSQPSFFLFSFFFFCLFSTRCIFLASAVVFCCVLRDKCVFVFQHSMPLAVPSLQQEGCSWLL